MENLIRFREMSERLSINEYQQFVDTIFGQNGDSQNMLSEILFHYFHQQLLHPSNDQNPTENITIDTINETIWNIIQNRSQNCNSDISDSQSEINALELHCIPHQTIQTIASYLPVESYLSFQHCNRFIFVTLRTPSMLRSLGGSMAAIRTSQTSSLVRSLLIHSRIIELIVSPRNVSAIKHIERYNLDKLVIHSTLKSTDFDYFLKNNTFNWSNIKYLNLYSYVRPWSESLVCSILNKCTGLSFLEFRQEDDTGYHVNVNMSPFNELRNIKHLTKLKGLSLDILDPYTGCMDPLLSHVSDSIESLHLGISYDMDFWNDNDITFSNLKEIHLFEPFPARFTRFANRAPKLERISLIDEDDLLYEEEDIDSIASSLRALFQLQSFKYFHFQFTSLNYVEDIADIFRQSLMGLQKTTLKIHLVFGNYYANYNELQRISINDMISQFNKLVCYLNDCCSHEFMLILQLQIELIGDEVTTQQLDKWINAMQDQYMVYSEILVDKQKLVIANKNNSFCGFKEKWIMCCTHSNCNNCIDGWGVYANEKNWNAYHNNFQAM